MFWNAKELIQLDIIDLNNRLKLLERLRFYSSNWNFQLCLSVCMVAHWLALSSHSMKITMLAWALPTACSLSSCVASLQVPTVQRHAGLVW